jgi:hypothetical protein
VLGRRGYQARMFSTVALRRLPAVVVSALLSSFSLALPANAETRHDEQVWLQAIAQGPVAGDVIYFAEVQSRFGDGASQLSQMLIRPAIGVKLNDRVAVYQGYANVRTPTAGGGETRENRSFQQVSWSLGRPGGIAISSRTRLEQRWLSNGSDVGWRLREMVRGAAPLGPDGKVALLAWGEVFVALNDTDWGARGGLDRLRGFAGLELPFSGKSTVEVGYLNQFVKLPGGRRQMDHTAAINLMLRQ